MLMMLTWPLHLIGVTEVFRSCDKHLCVGYWWPEGNHIKLSVMTDGGIFQRIDGGIWRRHTNKHLYTFNFIGLTAQTEADLPGLCLRSHSSKMASVKVCSRTKIGSLGDRCVCPPVPFRKRWARLCKLLTTGS